LLGIINDIFAQIQYNAVNSFLPQKKIVETAKETLEIFGNEII